MAEDLDYSGLKPVGQTPPQGAPTPSSLDFSKLKPAEAPSTKLDFSSLKPVQQKPQEDGVLSKIGRAFTEPVDRFRQHTQEEWKQGLETVRETLATEGEREKDKSSNAPAIADTLKFAGGAVQAAFAPATGAVKAFIGDPIRNTLGVKPITSEEGLTLNRAKNFVADTAETAGFMFGGAPVSKFAKESARAASDLAKPVASTIEKIFSPSTASPEGTVAANLRREETGVARRSTAQARAQMDQFAQQVNALKPDEQLKFIDYVENRSKGATLSDPKLAPVADKLRDLYQSRMNELKQLDKTKQMAFIEDYYPHMWQEKQPPKIEPGTAPRPPSQGSGRNLKQRTIPTIADGLKQGLTPVTTNPLETTMNYVANMDKFLAENRVIERARKLGDVKYFTPGNQPQGWVPLEGRLANKTATIPARTKIVGTGPNSYKVDIPARARPMKAYAPEGWARVYNNAVDPGVHRWPVAGQVYDTLQKAVNSTTMMELGLSGFHAYTMAQESMIDDLARSFGQFSRGAGKEGVKSLAKTGLGTPTPLSAGLKIKTGTKFMNQYLGLADHGPDFQKATDLFTRAGGRAEASRAEWMKGSKQMNYWDAWKKGALKSEVQGQWKDIKDRPIRGTMAQLGGTIARVMDTVAHPLFDQAIPKLKNGAFFDNMQEWLAAHPNATDKEQLQAAREIVDTIDDRFGELNMDNVFWNKMLKQSMQLMVRAVGWDLGTIRQIGGGAKDLGEYLAKGTLKPGRTADRIRYLIALPVLTALSTEVWSYLKTGKPSEDPFVFPTGGKNADGTPEKAMVPGYMKDVIGYTHDLPGSIEDEASSKVATMPRMVWDLMTNRDWRNLPIAEMSDWAQQNGAQGPFLAYMNNVWEHYEPMSLKTMQQQKQGTGLSVPENLFGLRRAPMYLGEPEQYAIMMERRRAQLDREKERSDARAKSQLKE